MEAGIMLIKKKISLNIRNFEALSPTQRHILQNALAVRKNAQAPYSGYAVGAAVQSIAGIHNGCNVERCTLSQTTHAEQAAIDGLIAHYGPNQKIVRLGVVGAPIGTKITFSSRNLWTSTDKIIVPCGPCLQSIWENCDSDDSVEIISRCSNGMVAITTIGDLLPYRFGPDKIKRQ